VAAKAMKPLYCDNQEDIGKLLKIQV